MKKNTIKINEAQLRNIIAESVKTVLKEDIEKNNELISTLENTIIVLENEIKNYYDFSDEYGMRAYDSCKSALDSLKKFVSGLETSFGMNDEI